MTSKVSTNATSSPESVAGRWPSGSPESLIARQSGRDRRRASLSLSLGVISDSQIPDTSRPRYSTLSLSDDRQFYLANRLKQLLANTGSILYSLTWKQRATPARRQYCQLVASVRRINAIEHFSQRSWPTTDTNNHRSPATGATQGWFREDGSKQQLRLQDVSNLAHWTTSSASDGSRGGNGITAGMSGSSLPQLAKLSTWSTCTTRDHKTGSTDMDNCLFRKDGKMRNDTVDTQAFLAAYPTPLTVPNSEKSRGQLSGSFRRAMEVCSPQIDNAVRITASGQVLTGWDAGMDISGPLNPAHSRWLMGYPPVWDDCAVTAMPSSRNSRRSSSKPGTPALTTTLCSDEEEL